MRSRVGDASVAGTNLVLMLNDLALENQPSLSRTFAVVIVQHYEPFIGILSILRGSGTRRRTSFCPLHETCIFVITPTALK